MTTFSTAFRLSSRLEQVGFSDIVQIRNKVMELRSQGKAVHQFEGGEPFLDTPEHIKSAMQEALAANRTRYAPSSGIPELRSAIARKVSERNHIPAAPDDVIIVNGGMQGLFGAFQCTLEPGDEVLLFSPYWTPIKDLVGWSQAKAVFVPTAQVRQNGMEATLGRYATARTRVIYFNTPQNPSGVVFTRAEAEAASRFAKERDLIVISDEAYEDLVYEGEHISIASLPGMLERTISCFTLSKSYAMTGWRAGYVICKEPWMTGIRKTTLYSTNGVSTPTQWAALAAINTLPAFHAEIRQAYLERRNLMVDGLNSLGLRCEMPRGAFYAFPDAGVIDPDSRKSAAKLLESAQVATVPGSVFGPHGEAHLRFSFSTSPETITAGLESIRRSGLL